MSIRLLFLWSLIDKVHKLVKLWSDDNLSATVALLAYRSIVRSQWIILTTTTCSKTLRIYTLMILQILNNRRCTKTREVPVVADILT